MATTTKDMWVANSVEPWKGDSKCTGCRFF